MTQNEKEAIRLLFEAIIKDGQLNTEATTSIRRVMDDVFQEASNKRRTLNDVLADLYTEYAMKQTDEDFIIREKVSKDAMEKYLTQMQVINLWSEANNNIKN